MTQEQLAGLLNVGRTTVARWERGEAQPQPWLRPQLARALNVSSERIEALLTGTEPPGAGDAPVPRQLPAALADFTGRAAELDTLNRVLEEIGSSAPATVAIGGTAGVGKTTLALYWAHQVADRFTDGQLYVNLRGFDPSGTPTTPAEAVRGFLDALGVPAGRIALLPDAQAELYRSVIADRKLLIVLDNARDEQQIRPLLPASPASMVLVTSRTQLTGLAADGARLLSLDVFPHAEAVQLLVSRVRAGRAAVEPNAVSEIAKRCACLPLALAVAAARATARTAFPLAALAAELRDSAVRLDALDVGDPMASVQAVFSWSYRQLSFEAARMFRLLGLHPGPDISLPAAASLAATSQSEARRLLRELARDCLITEHVPNRYAFHDLLRAYAATEARGRDSDSERAAATGRVLDYYLHTASRAALLLNPSYELVPLAQTRAGAEPGRPADHTEALAWFETEYQILVAAVTLASRSGLDQHAWQLPWAMTPFLEIRGRYQDWAAVERMAVAAATRLGDTVGLAVSSRLLANAWTEAGEYDQAFGCYMTSLELYRRLGNRHGEGKAHLHLAVLTERKGEYASALGHANRALCLFRALGHKAGEADALNAVGWCHGLLGDYTQARTFCRQALSVNEQVGYRRLEGYIWYSLGYAEQQLGNVIEAIACYRRALTVSREVGHRRVEAGTLAQLGDARYAVGQFREARDAWRQALAILHDLGHPDADQVRAKLDCRW